MTLDVDSNWPRRETLPLSTLQDRRTPKHATRCAEHNVIALPHVSDHGADALQVKVASLEATIDDLCNGAICAMERLWTHCRALRLCQLMSRPQDFGERDAELALLERELPLAPRGTGSGPTAQLLRWLEFVRRLPEPPSMQANGARAGVVAGPSSDNGVVGSHLDQVAAQVSRLRQAVEEVERSHAHTGSTFGFPDHPSPGYGAPKPVAAPLLPCQLLEEFGAALQNLDLKDAPTMVELPHGDADSKSGKACDAHFAFLQARVRDAQRRCIATWRTPAVERTVLRVASEESATFLIFDPGPRRVKLVLGEGGVPLCSYSDGHVPLEVVLLCHELQHGVRHGRKKGIHFRDASGQPISSMLSPQGSGASSQVGVMDQAVGDRTQLAMAAVGGVAAAVPVHIRSCSPQRSMTHCTSNMVAIARPPPQPGALPHPPSPHPIHCQLINVSQAATKWECCGAANSTVWIVGLETSFKVACTSPLAQV